MSESSFRIDSAPVVKAAPRKPVFKSWEQIEFEHAVFALAKIMDDERKAAKAAKR